jgi:pimeloyl-ACP methyl ester carboxylesterase
MQPRGHGRSSGFATYPNALQDVAAVLEWVESAGLAEDRGVVLGGHSWGGGISLAYAAAHESVGRILSIASSDHGVFIRRVDSDPAYGAAFREALGSLQAVAGPVRFDMEDDFQELREEWATHDLATIAPRLAGRDILIVAGWDDESVELEHQVLPFYRALREAGSTTVRILSYQDGHHFRKVREDLYKSVYAWLVGGGSG